MSLCQLISSAGRIVVLVLALFAADMRVRAQTDDLDALNAQGTQLYKLFVVRVFETDCIVI